MDVLLVKLELKDAEMYPPYGLLYVASALLKAEYTVGIFHEVYSKKTLDRLLDIIRKEKPKLVGFSVITDLSLHFALKSTREIGRCFPDIPIVWGGVHATCLPELCLSEPSVKYVVVGEGEKPMVELMDRLFRSGEPSKIEDIAGLGYRLDGKVYVNECPSLVEDLDSYPIPWHLVNVERYIDRGWIVFSTSRGCPYNCGFCFNSFMYKRRLRTHSIDYVMENISMLRDIYGISSVEFIDASFFVDRRRACKIVEAVDMPFKCSTRADDIDSTLADFLRQHRCKAVFIGVESGSQRLLDMMDKKTDVPSLRKTFELLSSRGVPATAYFILGLPSETDRELYDTIDFLLELHSVYGTDIASVKVYTPYPMTPLYSKTLALGWKPPTSNEGWGKMLRLRKCDMPWVKQKRLVGGFYALILLLQSENRFIPPNFLRRFVRWRLQNKRFELLFEPIVVEWYAMLKKILFKKRIAGTQTFSFR